ncbi:endonuclease [Pleurocapsa sp. CCALA 161]|uniref:type II toxin-antitoxin system YhaV family toxin n=1 Tax=Pleurocapsa sp. CCALA 161 TaxID=2107688 RepID=UPI000D0792DC|nr:type II toxin-antitoxin system YhaV family toxin [Pleurocapsa sp. CCALA 161]PSB06662.1 endonuclease [Pleurocapsa sp. CCALA 161]
MKINGWTILFHPLFNDQWQKLLHLVKSLRSRLPTDDFVKHPQVKLFKALTVGIEEKIPNDPKSSYFALRKPLDKYSRLKKMGLPNRYRLFFKVFPQQKVIIILWLGFPRKEGDKKDCPKGYRFAYYRVFAKMVKKGQFPLSLKDLIDSDNGQES